MTPSVRFRSPNRALIAALWIEAVAVACLAAYFLTLGIVLRGGFTGPAVDVPLATADTQGTLFRFRSASRDAEDSLGALTVRWQRQSLFVTGEIETDPSVESPANGESELTFCLSSPSSAGKGYVFTLRALCGSAKPSVVSFVGGRWQPTEVQPRHRVWPTPSGRAFEVELPLPNKGDEGGTVQFSATVRIRRGEGWLSERVWDDAQDAPLVLNLTDRGWPTALARLYPVWSRLKARGGMPRLEEASADEIWRQRSSRNGYRVLFITDQGIVGSGAEVRGEGGKVLWQGRATRKGNHVVGNAEVPYSSRPCSLLIGGRLVCRFIPAWKGVAVLQRKVDRYEEPPIWFSDYVFGGARFPEPQFREPARVLSHCQGTFLRVRYFDSGFNDVLAPSLPGRYGAVVEATTTMRHWVFSTLFAKGTEFGTVRPLPTQPLPRRTSGEVLAMAYAAATERPAVASRASIGRQTAGAFAVFDEDQAWWIELRRRHKVPFPMQVVLPPGYEREPNRRWTTLLFLHGGGAQDLGQLPKLLAADDFRKMLAKHPRPVVVVEPMLSIGDLRWSGALVRLALDQAMERYRIDPDRVVLCGESSGGTGTWRVAEQEPTLFAGAMPLSSVATLQDPARLRHVPFWCFQYKKDAPETIEAAAHAIRAAGGDARVTVVAGNGHLTGWAAWQREDVWSWILARRRNGVAAQVEQNREP